MTTTTIEEPKSQDDANNVVELRPRKAPTGGKSAKDRKGDDAGVGSHTQPLAHDIEALLFISSTPLAVDAIAKAADVEEDEVQDTLVAMMQRYSEGTSGLVLERVAGGWAFRASDSSRDTLARLFDPQADMKLSPAALETLAVVSYLQPISRPDVARIRGVSVDAAMSSLLERGFVEEAGRSDSGAVQFRTTALFERAFGLASVAALPELDGFGPGPEEVARLREQLEQMASARVE